MMIYNDVIKERSVLLKKEEGMKALKEEKLTDLNHYIKTYQIKHGQSPSYRNIMTHLKFSSLSVVNRYVDALKERGMIEKSQNGKIDTLSEFDSRNVTIAPVVGVVTCGQPILAEENVEGVYALPSEIFGNGELFILHAEGDSMIDAGINSGDMLVVKKTNSAENGEIVVALLEDSATVKRFYKKKNHIVLHPENEKYDDIVVNDVRILGVVKHCIHRF